jgi:hypothetical protein
MKLHTLAAAAPRGRRGWARSDRTRGEIARRHASVSPRNRIVSRLRHLSELSVVRSSVATTAMLGVALLIGLPGVPWVRWTLLGLGVRLDRRTHPGPAPHVRQGEA